MCRKHSHTYQPGNLSDGEKQVVALLADLTIVGNPRGVILVDEPELNLNSHLACRLWDSIEGGLPEAVFVYATHSLGFAMRTNVDKTIVLSGWENPATEVSDISEVDPAELRGFLGAIPAILAAQMALVVEGRDASFDVLFYDWLLAQAGIVVVPVGGSNDVQAVVKRLGVWERLAPSARIVGVVDRDFRSDRMLKSLGEEEACCSLELHEAESYLCWPQIICDLANALGIAEKVPSLEEATETIYRFYEEQRLSIAAKRTFDRIKVSLGVSLDRRVLSQLDSEGKVREAIRRSANCERARAERLISEDAAVRIFDQELARVKRASGNVGDVLELAPGKELLSRLMRHSGCNSPSEVARGVSKHLNATDYSHLMRLRANLLQRLGIRGRDDEQGGEDSPGELLDPERTSRNGAGAPYR